MALGSTQSVRERNTRNLSGDRRRPAFKADKLTAVGESIVKKRMWEPSRLINLWASIACHMNSLSILHGNHNCCWKIHLSAKLVLPTTIGCSHLSAPCVTTITRVIITILLYKEIYIYYIVFKHPVILIHS